VLERNAELDPRTAAALCRATLRRSACPASGESSEHHCQQCQPHETHRAVPCRGDRAIGTIAQIAETGQRGRGGGAAATDCQPRAIMQASLSRVLRARALS
jgi:hypothetical protein